ncbi:hypothetical protein P3T36_001269 [Kitasatospora sp. MAP12-15]|nr:hypothetical protein [Kitasatospora sp. MAP12-44]
MLRPLLITVTAAASAVSFALSLHWTHSSVSLAYLGSPSRVWQFGVGALLALLPLDRLRPARQPLRALLRPLLALCGWAGAAAIGWSVVRFNSATPYPGYPALLPTLGRGPPRPLPRPGRRGRRQPACRLRQFGRPGHRARASDAGGPRQRRDPAGQAVLSRPTAHRP